MSEKKPWKPKQQYLAEMTPQEFAAYEARKAARGKKKAANRPVKKAVKKYARKQGYSQGYGGRRGQSIVYPNIVGSGPYYLEGSLNTDWLKVKGGIRSSDYVQGMGPYAVKKNSLLHAIDLGQPVPKVRNTNKNEATVVNHAEYVGELLASTDFNLQKYSLNPGNTQLFPFLARIAQQYEEYEIRGMLFELRSECSEFAAQLSLGSMFMACNYNVQCPDPISKQQLENMEYASSSKPSCSMIMPVECEPVNNTSTHKYVAINGDYHGGDSKTYDWGNVYIGSQGQPEDQEGQPIAEIWCTYEVALFKPLIAGNELSVNCPTLHWHIAGGENSSALGTVEAGSYAGYGSSPDITVDGDRITWGAGAAPGYYLILITYINNPAISGTAIQPPAVTYGPNMFQATCWASGASGPNINNAQGCTGLVGETTFERATIVSVSPAATGLVDPTLSFATVTLTTAAGYQLNGDLIVTKISDSVTWGTGDTAAPAVQFTKNPVDEFLFRKLQALEDKYIALLEEKKQEEFTVVSSTPQEPSVRELLNQLAGKK